MAFLPCSVPSFRLSPQTQSLCVLLPMYSPGGSAVRRLMVGGKIVVPTTPLASIRISTVSLEKLVAQSAVRKRLNLIRLAIRGNPAADGSLLHAHGAIDPTASVLLTVATLHSCLPAQAHRSPPAPQSAIAAYSNCRCCSIRCSMRLLCRYRLTDGKHPNPIEI